MTAMLNPAPRRSHARGNTVVPSRWQATPDQHRVFGDGVGIDGLFRVRGRGVMEGKQGTGDLVGPAPGVGSVGGGVVVGDGLELTEKVRIAQGVLSGGVGVVRRPRVVDGGAGESRQDPHAVHRFGTAPAAVSYTHLTLPTKRIV